MSLSNRLSQAGLNPWELPLNESFYPQDDPFSCVDEEESVLSHMMLNPGHLTALDPCLFTSRDRKAIFSQLNSGVRYSDIDCARLDMPGYPAELFFILGTAPRIIREMVDNLRRLAELRALNYRVCEWQRRAPTMTVTSARVALTQCLRRECR